MRRITGAKPSPALLVAVVALVAALAGTAVAGVAVTSLSKKDKKQVTKIAKKQGKKQGKKQANKQIDKKAPGLSVASAKTADSATTADIANGVKPVKVSFAAAADSGPTVFLDEGGIRIEGSCTPGGAARVLYESTADDGTIYVALLLPDLTHLGGGSVDWNAGASRTTTTIGVADPIMQTTLTYRGADGTTVSGELTQARDAGAAQCTIGGTLFVG